MNHWIVVPVVLPAVMAPFIIMVIRYHLDLQRIFSVASVVALVAVSLALTAQAATGEIQVYELGDWPAPFGIVLVLDRLSAMMILLTSVLALAVLLYAIGSGWDDRGWHFHALYQFQLMGVLGAFLTGDAFNLFVFFEVLLIASYGLMIHSGGAPRLRAGVQYVVYNLLGSTLFLFALGTIYAVTGTLNMADLAVRVAELPAEETALIRVGAVLLLLVFAIKAAVLPLHFWLPATYANAPAPVAALFAIMTKVGAYSILRVYTLVFGPDQPIMAGLSGDWLQVAALLTLAAGMIGILGSREIGRLVAFAAIGSMGTLLVAISLFTQQAVGVAIFYIVHSTLATATMFLVADLIIERRGPEISATEPMPQNEQIAGLYFLGAIALAGMPPLSGFLGKLMVMDAAWGSPQLAVTWSVIVITSLVAIIGLARAGSLLFWKSWDPIAVPVAAEEPVPGSQDIPPDLPQAAVSPLTFAAVWSLIAGLVLLTVFAGPAMDYAADHGAATGPQARLYRCGPGEAHPMKLIHKLFPHPWLSTLLTAVWIMLGNSFSLNALLFGLFLGIVIPLLTQAYWPNRPKLKNPRMIAEYMVIVLYDIVVANITVAKLILFTRNEDMTPNWVSIPLELRTPEAITALAGTITMTPGTLSSDLSSEGHHLLVHCLNAPDPDAVRDEIKQRYERRLKEIFE